MSAEAILATGYAVFLMLAATGLDLLARHSHRRSARYRTAGFTFRPDLDLWECPEGQELHRVDTDHGRRLAHYRARPAVCNACPAKAECTDSDHGRQITRALDPWPHSEAGRFHRGVCVVLVVLAAVIAGLALIRSDGPAEAVRARRSVRGRARVSRTAARRLPAPAEWLPGRLGAGAVPAVGLRRPMPAPLRSPELAELRAFCAAADLGSIGRAAITLGISQPALSKRHRTRGGRGRRAAGALGATGGQRAIHNQP